MGINRVRSGFTIVELLIVIVVIAVLAAITIVAYNNMTNRATNSSVMAATNQVIKLTKAYLATNSSYPITSRTCALQSTCYYGGLVGTNATFTSNIATIGTLPGGVPTWHTTYGGVLYDYSALRTYNGNSNPLIVMYFLRGANANCGMEVANSPLGDTMVTSSNAWSAVVGTTTICYAPIAS